LLAGLAVIGGCGGIRNPVSRDSLIRNNPTPELKTLDLRDVDRDNRRAIAVDEDWRMLAEDWDRMWYLNHASHLTIYPVR
jgi:hypothetical protein